MKNGKNITIHDIAKLAGCSSGTVSRAINNRAGISLETRNRILKVMEELGYRPNAIAQSLAFKQTHTVALVIPDISNPFLGKIALAADKELFKHQYNMMLCNTYWNTETELEKLRFIQEKRVDGIIFKPSSGDIDFVRQSGIPTVLLSHTVEGAFSFVDIDNELAAFRATEYLWNCGYRRIAMISGHNHAGMVEDLRLQGYQRALREHGVPFNRQYVWHGNYSIQNGYQAMEYFLKLPEVPDALLCGDDMGALGVYQKCSEAGIAIPDEMGLIGFTNDDIAALPQFGLTSIAQPKDIIGELAAQTLISMLENKNEANTGVPRKILLYPELVVRNTTRKTG